jgi:hypothetical protein
MEDRMLEPKQIISRWRSIKNNLNGMALELNYPKT